MTLLPLAAEDPVFVLRSTPRQTAVVELFTSEGCSSCPPAEKWLGGFVDSPGLWRDFVPVVWHVDYWDGLGWPDRFASKANTERQERYSAQWHRPSIYTPGFVLNGTEWRDWPGSTALSKLAKPEVGVLEVKDAGTNRFQVTFTAPTTDTGHFETTVAWLGSNLVNDVRGGENAGRKLRHNFVVLRSVRAALGADAGGLTTVISLPRPALHAGERLALAAWISPAKDLTPLQAVGGWVEEGKR